MTVEAWLPSSSGSSTPVTVTVWAVFQFDVVNVRVDGLTEASPESDLVTLTTTLEDGATLSTTVNVSVVPVSETDVEVLDRVMPGESSSVVVADNVWSARLSKALSELASLTDTVIVVDWSPSLIVSSTPVTVTVWAVSQLDVVNVSDEVDTVASPVSALDTLNTTSDVGWALRTTVNVSVDPASVTEVEPPDAATVKPGESSSAVVTTTVRSLRAS